MNFQNNVYNYKKLTVETFEKAMKSCFEKQKQSRHFVLYTSELSGIELDCYINWETFKSKSSKTIINLFKKLSIIRKIILLNKIKKHHITVGYSLMTKENFDIKINKWIDMEEEIIKTIKELYYDRNK